MSAGCKEVASEKRNIVINSCRNILTSTAVSADAGVACDTKDKEKRVRNGCNLINILTLTLDERNIAFYPSKREICSFHRRDNGIAATHQHLAQW